MKNKALLTKPKKKLAEVSAYNKNSFKDGEGAEHFLHFLCKTKYSSENSVNDKINITIIITILE